MIDGIIRADGTSRLMRATLPATYEGFKAQAALGTLPLDVLFNANGWSQIPTFLNKANLLKDETAALFDLDSGAVLDDVFSLVGKYNTHWWSILHGQAGKGYDEVKTQATPLESDHSGTIGLTGDTSVSQQDIYYSKTVTVDQKTGAVSLDNLQTFAVKNSTTPTTVSDQLSSLAAMAPVYITNLYDDPETIYFVPSGVTVNTNAFAGFMGSNIETFGISRDAESVFFPKMNLSANCANPVYVVTSQVYNIPAGETTYEHSANRNAYPDSGTVDGLTYQYLGVPFQNAVTASKIATGSYTGTGTYGASNPNSLTFDFEPKVVFVSTERQGSASPYVWGARVWYIHQGTSRTPTYVDISGTTMSWYITGSYAGDQYNTSGEKYYYVAIG